MCKLVTGLLINKCKLFSGRDNIYKIKWTEKYKPNESFEYDKKGNLIIIDMVFSSPCFHIYTNGSISMTARTM